MPLARTGETCTADHCVETSRSCIDVNDCPTGTTCDQNRCVGGSSCLDTADCPAGQVCRANSCEDSEVECDTSDDCDDGICEDGICREP